MTNQEDELIRTKCRKFLKEINTLSDLDLIRPLIVIGINSRGITDVSFLDVLSPEAVNKLLDTARKMLAKGR